jgi:DNA sulfur modification protein DndD
MLSINRIIIKNFRQYKNINLTFASKKGLFLFIGKNGMGKSNLLNAICWCLYERQPFKFHDKEKKLLNEEASRNNEWDEASVSLEVSMNENTFLFQRKQRESQPSQLTVMIKHGENWDVAPNPTVIVNSFLPESVRKFFLFDGEAVQNLYKGDYSTNLKAGVWRVSNVELLDRASENLYKTKEELRRTVSRDDPSTESIEVELADHEKQKVTHEKDLNLKRIELSKLKEKKIEFSERLKQYSKYKTLQDRRDLLESNLKRANERLQEYQRQINDLIISMGPFWYIKEALLTVATKINDESIKGKLPPKIRGTFIKELVEKKECICGRSITEGHEEHKHLTALLSDVETLDNRSFLLDDKAEINSLMRELGIDIYNNMKNIREQKSKERKIIEDLQLELKEISGHLVNAPDKEVGDIESTIQRMENQMDVYSQDIGQLNEKLSVSTQRIGEIRGTLDKLNRNKSKRQQEQAKLDFLEEAHDRINYVRERLISQVRKSVSLHTDKYFKELIWKKDEFDRVNFTDDYRVEIFKNDESTSSLEILSTGEMKVLSFATIKALAELSGFSEVPIFIDGPLENLDKEVRSSFLAQLPTFITNKQVFIFSLDSDLIEEFGRTHVPKENYYKLSRDKDSLSTIIKQYN